MLVFIFPLVFVFVLVSNFVVVFDLRAPLTLVFVFLSFSFSFSFRFYSRSRFIPRFHPHRRFDPLSFCSGSHGFSLASNNRFLNDTFLSQVLLYFRPFKIIWHGSKRNGHLQENGNCDKWRKNGRTSFSYGAPINGTTTVVAPQKYYCDNKFIVLCIEVGLRS